MGGTVRGPEQPYLPITLFGASSEHSQACSGPPPQVTSLASHCFSLLVADPARVLNMPPVIYVPVGIHGYIRCPVDAEPPATVVKWNKDGRPLQVEKVLRAVGMEVLICSIHAAQVKHIGRIQCRHMYKQVEHRHGAHM